MHVTPHPYSRAPAKSSGAKKEKGSNHRGTEAQRTQTQREKEEKEKKTSSFSSFSSFLLCASVPLWLVTF
jgi:hypothetical protein